MVINKSMLLKIIASIYLYSPKSSKANSPYSDLGDLMGNRTHIQFWNFWFWWMEFFASFKKAITLTILKINIWINSPVSKAIVKMTEMIGTVAFWFILVEIHNHDYGLILSYVQKFLDITLKFTYSQIHEHVFMFFQSPPFLLKNILAFQNSLNYHPSW